MPFVSQSQERAAFGGYLGDEMKQKADTWAHESGQGGSKTHPKGSAISKKNFDKLPDHVKKVEAIKRKAKELGTK